MDEWMNWYRWIVELLHIDPSMDRKATSILSELVKDIEPPINELATVLRDRNVFVFGAGPSLEPKLNEMVSFYKDILESSPKIAANGATKALIERGIVPEVVTTDLDGDIDYILTAAEKGSIIIIHGHGDNIDKLLKYVPLIKKRTLKIIATTQVKPLNKVYNFGGFTDGDRAVFLAYHFKSKKVIMAGMDFGEIVGKYSKPWLKDNVKASYRKRTKLYIAERLISWIARKPGIEIYTLSEYAPQYVIKINIKDIPKIVGQP